MEDVDNKEENTDRSGNQASRISKRTMDANRANAQKSTGPRTPEGKKKSRFNAVKHGLLAKKLMFSSQGQPVDESLTALLESLRDQYGRGDVRTELLFEGIVTDYWRSHKGLEHEMKFVGVKEHFGPDGYISNLHRYNTANHRSMIKSLELLEKLVPKQEPTGEGDTSGQKEESSSSQSGDTQPNPQDGKPPDSVQ